MNQPTITYNPDNDVIMSIEGPLIRADWYRAGEGYNGDYNPNDPHDEELLRFDIYIADDIGVTWEPVDDASYCTCVSVHTDKKTLEKKLMIIYNEYNDALSDDPYASVKKLGERLSYI